jgi:hypothetical protein
MDVLTGLAPDIAAILGGETVTLTAPAGGSSIRTLDGNGPTTLELAAAALEGATTITVRAVGASGMAETSFVAAGTLARIGGTDHTVQADATGAEPMTLTISALAADAAEDDTVELRDATYQSTEAVITRKPQASRGLADVVPGAGSLPVATRVAIRASLIPSTVTVTPDWTATLQEGSYAIIGPGPDEVGWRNFEVAAKG